jgi:methionyl-tRNA formyltransferase
MPLSFGFAGTPEFAATILQRLLHHKYIPKVVYTQPDRKKGRGQTIQASPVKQLALAHKLPLEQPKKLDTQALPQFTTYALDLLVVAAYGLVLPQTYLNHPHHGCINVHASLLPKFRGASPIAQAILHGEATTGITMMQMEAGLDTGPILMQRAIPITPNDDSATLTNKLAILGGECLCHTLDNLHHQQQHATAQNHALASLAPKIKKQDACLNWHQSAHQLERTIRAYRPWPVAYFEQQHRLRVWAATAYPTHTRNQPPGTILSCSNKGLDIQTAQGILRITAWQFAGKTIQHATQTTQSFPAWLQPGTQLQCS